jgi:hypothetical protein
MEGRGLSDDYNERLSVRANEAHTKIEKAVDIGSFIFGDEAGQRLNRFQKEAKETSNTPQWEQYLEGNLAATESFLKHRIP